ncbi:rhodanese-like domain-containing protein [bacterium]|nr:rhodanese-like domain-containing protein [bacterium]
MINSLKRFSTTVRSELFKIIVLVGLAGVLAVTANALRTDRLAWFGYQTVARTNPAILTVADVVHAYYADNAYLVDVRASDAFYKAHLAASIHLPSNDFQTNFEMVFEKLPAEGMLILYGDDHDLEAPEKVRQLLLARGFRAEDVAVFEAGWEALSKQKEISVISGADDE